MHGRSKGELKLCPTHTHTHTHTPAAYSCGFVGEQKYFVEMDGTPSPIVPPLLSGMYHYAKHQYAVENGVSILYISFMLSAMLTNMCPGMN